MMIWWFDFQICSTTYWDSSVTLLTSLTCLNRIKCFLWTFHLAQMWNWRAKWDKTLHKSAWCSDLVLCSQKAYLTYATMFSMKEWLSGFLLFEMRFCNVKLCHITRFQSWGTITLIILHYTNLKTCYWESWQVFGRQTHNHRNSLPLLLHASRGDRHELCASSWGRGGGEPTTNDGMDDTATWTWLFCFLRV